MAAVGGVQIIGAGRILAAGTVQWSRGGIVLSRSAAGIYLCTLSDLQLDADEGLVVAIPEGANPTVQVVHTSDTVKTINVATASTGAALDANLTVLVIKVAHGLA